MIATTAEARRILSPIQLGLFFVVGVFVVVFLVLIVRAYIDAGDTADGVETASFEITGLANIQRETLVLQSELGRLLRDPDRGFDAHDVRRALLGNQVRLVGSKATNDTGLTAKLNEIRQTLVVYDQELAAYRAGLVDGQVGDPGPLDETVIRLERQVKVLYDQEETSFFVATSRQLLSQRNAQVLLAGVSVLVLISGGILGVSLRRTVGALRTEMIERDRVQVDLRDANQELVKAQDQVVRSEKLAAIGQMSGGVAHDLRNPLGAIKNAAFMLNKRLVSDGATESNPRLSHYLETIDQQIARSNRIITDLMTFARVSPPTLTAMRVEDILEESLTTMSHQENVRLSKDVANDLRPVMADGEQLQRVFLNLGNNAQEAMPDGGELKISAQAVNGHIEIAFVDSGAGISDENLERIFDPLFTTKTKGTGLGLAVCQEIIMRHGGQITASRNPEPGCGSTFAITLPAANAEALPEGENIDEQRPE